MAIQKTSTLRPSTLQQRLEVENKPIVHSGRKIIPVEQAATRLQTPHDCSHDADMAKDKAQRRIAALFIRFATTQLLACKTTRVSTDLQSGQSHCRQCECAHWATTSALRDDKMPRVLQDITNGAALSPNKALYLKRRVDFNTPEKNKFNALSDPNEKVSFVRSRMAQQDMHNSFNGTAYAKQLSSTLEGPKEANDLDQSLESRFRPIEDALSVDVHAGKLNFRQATIMAYNDLEEKLKLAVFNLLLRISQFERYIALERGVDRIETAFSMGAPVSKELVDEYAKTINELINLRSQIIKKLLFSVNLKQASNFEQISHRLDFFWLKMFDAQIGSLNDPSDRKKAFELHMQRIKKTIPALNPAALSKARVRLLEAQAQLEGMSDLGVCNITKLDTWLFGISESGVRRTPTEDELRKQLIDMTQKENVAAKCLPTPIMSENCQP